MSSLALVRAACDRHTYGTAPVSHARVIVSAPAARRLSVAQCIARAALVCLAFVAFSLAFAYAATMPLGVGP